MTSDFAIPETLRSTLGSPLQVHGSAEGSGRTGYFTTGTILTILTGIIVIGIVRPPEHNEPSPIVFIALMGVCGALALISFVVGLLSKGSKLILFPDGLARTGWAAPEIFRWNDIKEVYTFASPVAKKYRIVTRNGRKFEIDASVKDGRELGQTVKQSLFDRMLPVAVKAFEAGDAVVFGPLRLDQSFLYCRKRRLAWSEIANIELSYDARTLSTQFEVTAAGDTLLPWCAVKTQDIPNLDIFQVLAERKRSASACQTLSIPA